MSGWMVAVWVAIAGMVGFMSGCLVMYRDQEALCTMLRDVRAKLAESESFKERWRQVALEQCEEARSASQANAVKPKKSRTYKKTANAKKR